MKRPNLKKYTNKRFCHQLGNQELYKTTFLIGDLYLFHPTKKYCPSRSSLWGIYDKTEDGIIYLESSTFDLVHFNLWHRLPEVYRNSRRATRRELRDYMYNLGHSDSLMQHINTRHQLSKIRPQSLFICSRPRHSFSRNMLNSKQYIIQQREA